jgi:hypothetical protein
MNGMGWRYFSWLTCFRTAPRFLFGGAAHFVWMLIDADRCWSTVEGACVSRQPDHRSPFGLVEKEYIRTVRLIRTVRWLIIVFSPKPLYFTGIPVSLMFIYKDEVIGIRILGTWYRMISPHHHSLVQVLQSVQVDLKLGCLAQQHPTSSGWPSWFSGTNTFVKHWLM